MRYVKHIVHPQDAGYIYLDKLADNTLCPLHRFIHAGSGDIEVYSQHKEIQLDAFQMILFGKYYAFEYTEKNRQ